MKLTCGLAALLVILGALPASPADPQFSALVFSKTTGFRHSSIPDGIAAIRKLGVEHNFAVDASEDPGVFTDQNLARYKVVIFLNTTGTLFNDAQRAAFERYIRAGGGWVGVHAASDTEYDWPFYGELVGAYFKTHPKTQPAVVHVEDRAHPSTAPLPENWKRTDEWYSFRASPRGSVHVLATVDESSYTGGAMGDHPIAWCHDFQGGRAWFTALGHTPESYSERLFLTHLLGGILTAAGVMPADCRVEPGGAGK